MEIQNTRNKKAGTNKRKDRIRKKPTTWNYKNRAIEKTHKTSMRSKGYEKRKSNMSTKRGYYKEILIKKSRGMENVQKNQPFKKYKYRTGLAK